jgi:hypothetical protein
MSGIIRTVKDKGYFVASNTPFNDKRLSWEARGVLAYLLSKPDGWITRNGDLLKNGPAGERKIGRILKELQALGYMTRERVHEDGRFDWVTCVYESPQIQYRRFEGIENVGIQNVGIYKELSVENTDNNQREFSSNGWGELLDYFTEVTGIAQPRGLSDETARQEWFEPLADIYKIAGNIARTKELITDTTKVLRANPRYRIRNPRSLYKTAVSLAENGAYSAVVVSDV